MADKTVIYNPPPVQKESNAGWIVGLIVLIIVVLFLIFGLSKVRRQDTEINVPDKIQIETK